MAEKIALHVKKLNSEETEIVSKLYNEEAQENIRFGPKGYCVPISYMKIASDIYNMELRPDDVFVVTYQRSGTTWTQELIWLLENDLNYDKAAQISLIRRYSFLELSMFIDDKAKKITHEIMKQSEEARTFIEAYTTPATEVLPTLPSPRFIKTHLPLSLLPPTLLDSCKVVYVARDPRDVVVSCYHHARLFKVMKFQGSFRELWNAFTKDLYILNPYFEHVKEAWALRQHPNMLFLFYEELLQDLPAVIRRVAKFLNKELTQQQIDRLCDHLSIENFKNNKSVNFEELRDFGLLDENETFIRKGTSGGWRDYFDEEMNEQAEKWIVDNLKDTELQFPHMGI